jgi:hypothetical protein
MGRFRSRAGFVLLLAPLAPSVWADATLRYHTDIQTSGAIGIAMPINQALGGLRDMVIRIKGNKAYSSQGNLISIMDLMTQELILIDAPHKRFASVPASQYTAQLKSAVPAMPEATRAVFASMKSNVVSRSTGRTATIQGIQTEEQEFVLSIDMPLPGAPPTPGPFMKMVMQVWTAKPGETERVPALQEFRNYTASASAMNPADMMKQVLGGLPGMGDSMGAMIEEISKKGALSLRMHTEVFLPALAILSRQLPQRPGQPPLPVLDPDAPLMQMNQEVVELSTDPLDDSLFQVPQDYQAAPLEDILKAAVSQATPAAPPVPPAPPPAAPPPQPRQ